MKPNIIYNKRYEGIGSENVLNEIYFILRSDVAWEHRDAPREECFMSLVPLSYTYGKGVGERTYHSLAFHPLVLELMNKLNSEFNSEYNICFLNYYKSEKEHLGWHADDSPEMDKTHPIAVVSFGADRLIYIKEKEYRGEIPKDDQYMLGNCSLFIMPAGMQETHYHKIPKGDKPCGGRISLTFRKYKI